MKPTKGRIVLVTVPGDPVNGQEEHAAIITQVWSETLINTMTFPGIGSPRPVTSVDYADPPHAMQRSWRWPPRE